MKISYIIEYRVNSSEPDDVVPWIEARHAMSHADAVHQLAWHREHVKVTRLQGKPITWRVRQITEEILPL